MTDSDYLIALAKRADKPRDAIRLRAVAKHLSELERRVWRLAGVLADAGIHFPQATIKTEN